MAVSLEDILDISPTEGRRGLEKAQAIVKELMVAKPVVKTKPGTLKSATKVVE